MEDFEHIREQLNEPEDPQSLNEARDAVRRHVEAKQQLDKAELDMACEAVGHTVSKMLPCQNPDFLCKYVCTDNIFQHMPLLVSISSTCLCCEHLQHMSLL